MRKMQVSSVYKPIPKDTIITGFSKEERFAGRPSSESTQMDIDISKPQVVGLIL